MDLMILLKGPLPGLIRLDLRYMIERNSEEPMKGMFCPNPQLTLTSTIPKPEP